MSRRATASLWIGGLLAAAVVAGAAAGAALPAGAAVAMRIPQRLLPPGPGHPLGTDQFGRDQLTRLLVGALASLEVGTIATAVGLALGVPLGAAAAVGGRRRDEVLMRLTDGLYAFPALLLALMVVAVLGPGLLHTALALGVVTAPPFARLTRARLLELRPLAYVEAARAAGETDWQVLRRHLLPGAFGALAVQASASLGGAILVEAALSYLGLGVQPPQPSWGRMLSEAQTFFLTSPWLALFPGLAVTAAVLGFNLLGDGLSDLLDPRARG
jgi:peptide/nickel transport system permease protein